MEGKMIAALVVWSGVQAAMFLPLERMTIPTRTDVITVASASDKSLTNTIAQQKKPRLLSEVIEQARTQFCPLPRGLLEGMILHESGFDELARNPEQQLYARKRHRGWTKDDAASRGLMQVVFGWHKKEFNLKSPKQLDDMETNIMVGAQVLCGAIAREKGDLFKGVGRFNGDMTGRYASAVFREARRFH